MSSAVHADRLVRRPATGASLLCGAVLGALLVAACGATTEPTLGAGVDAVSERGTAVVVTNRTAASVYTFTIGRNAAAYTDWYPCVDAASCPPIAPGASRTEPIATPPGRPAEREALVYWWHAVAGPRGEPRPDSIRVSIVRL